MTDAKKIKPFETPIYVTRPSLFPLEEFVESLRDT
jgi:hypothetical protein